MLSHLYQINRFPDPDPPADPPADPPVEVSTEAAIAKLQEEKYMVFTPDSFKEKEKKIRKDEAINAVGKTHGMYDDLFKELSGVDRDEDEKTIDYGKRAVTGMVEKAQGDPSDQLKSLTSQLSDTKTKYNDLQAQMDAQKGDFEKKWSENLVKNEYRNGLLNIIPKLGYQNESEQQVALAGFESLFFNEHNIEPDESGNLVVKDSSGTVMTDEKLQNLSPSQAVQVFAQKMLKFSNGAPGGGAGTKSPSGSGTPPISNKQELDEYLEKKGYDLGSEEWVNERAKMIKELAL